MKYLILTVKFINYSIYKGSASIFNIYYYLMLIKKNIETPL